FESSSSSLDEQFNQRPRVHLHGRRCLPISAHPVEVLAVRFQESGMFQEMFCERVVVHGRSPSPCLIILAYTTPIKDNRCNRHSHQSATAGSFFLTCPFISSTMRGV